MKIALPPNIEQLAPDVQLAFQSLIVQLNRDADVLGFRDGVTPPVAESGKAKLYVDIADSALKMKHGNGTVQTL